ncbi:MAG: hypothetical protein ACJ74Z_01515 [Bryobacteraceae bacterium]
MNKRPLSVVVIGWLYIATGAFGLVFHLIELKPFQSDLVWIALVNLIAITSGIYILRGSNWARWAAIAWMGFHVVLSVFHSWLELAVHSLLFLAIAYFLFRLRAMQYFRTVSAGD